MRDAWIGMWAIVGVTLREAYRQRLWLLVAAVCVLLVVLIPAAGAVDEAARLKLAVAAITGASGFVVTLLGALIGAAAVRRDIDTRIGFMLFSKPLARGAWVGGRWLGVVVALLIATAGLMLAGTLSTWLRLGELPDPRRAIAPAQTWRIENGQAIALAHDLEAVILSGAPLRGEGEGLRWRFADLPAASGDGFQVLVRVQVGGAAGLNAQARVALSAMDERGTAVALPLADDSPYGEDIWEEQNVAAHQVFLLNRTRNRRDLAQDYARFDVPAGLVTDGGLVVQLNRLDGGTRIRIDRDSVYLAAGGGSFFGNMVRAELVQLAQAALLAAVTIALATVAKIGTALLGGLTLYFGGNTLGFIEEGMRWEDFGRVTERGLQILLTVLPDFGRYPVERSLAASQQVAWGTVFEAWGYYGAYAALFLALAWWSIRRAEL